MMKLKTVVNPLYALPTIKCLSTVYLFQTKNYKTKVSVALPVAPRKRITSILYDTAKRMTSAERPYVIKMKNDYTQKVTTVAFKTDDMRRDQIFVKLYQINGYYTQTRT